MLRREFRVAVCTPCGDQVAAEYAFSLASMLQFTAMSQPRGLVQLGTFSLRCSMLTYSRTVIARQALAADATHLLWIDSDMSFPKDTILRLLGRSQALIGINAMARRPPFNMTAQREAGVELPVQATGLERVHRCGFGVLWMESQVLRALGEPWFDFQWSDDHKTMRGEDFYFCEKARAAGYEVHVDHELSGLVRHIGTAEYGPHLAAKS